MSQTREVPVNLLPVCHKEKEDLFLALVEKIDHPIIADFIPIQMGITAQLFCGNIKWGVNNALDRLLTPLAPIAREFSEIF